MFCRGGTWATASSCHGPPVAWRVCMRQPALPSFQCFAPPGSVWIDQVFPPCRPSHHHRVQEQWSSHGTTSLAEVRGISSAHAWLRVVQRWYQVRPLVRLFPPLLCSSCNPPQLLSNKLLLTSHLSHNVPSDSQSPSMVVAGGGNSSLCWWRCWRKCRGWSSRLKANYGPIPN